MSSSPENEVEVPSKRKKGVVNSDKYKRNIIKKARIRGEQYKNYSGDIVPAKVAAGNYW